VTIGCKFQSLGKISNISTSDPPVLLGQFQHWIYIVQHRIIGYRVLTFFANWVITHFGLFFSKFGVISQIWEAELVNIQVNNERGLT